MIEQINMVKEFHEAFNVPILNSPDFPSNERIELRNNLLKEEMRELEEASVNWDMIETLDGIVDCLYVLFGTALEFGLQDKLVAAFTEIHQSNMSKLDENGKPVKREDGKVIKSHLFKKPDLNSILYA